MFPFDWSPLEEQFHNWTVVVETPMQTSRAFLAPTVGVMTTPDTGWSGAAPWEMTFRLRSNVALPAATDRWIAGQWVGANTVQKWFLGARTGASGLVFGVYNDTGVRLDYQVATPAQMTALFVPGVDVWLRVRLTATAATGFSSADGLNWTLLRNHPASYTGPRVSTSDLMIGVHSGTTDMWDGRIYSGQATSLDVGMNATSLLWRFDAEEYLPGSGLSFTDPRGKVWTMSAANAITPAVYSLERWVLDQWAGIDLSWTLDGVHTDIEVLADDPVVAYIRDLVTDVYFYRDHTLLFRMRVIDSEDSVDRESHRVKWTCVGYETLLGRRILHEGWVLDDLDINAAWRLIDYTQQKFPLGITRGTAANGVQRQRTLDGGDTILESINDFAEDENGFDWWIDANLAFHAAKPRRGKVLADEWQVGNDVAELTRTAPMDDYATLVMATGAQNETTIGATVYPPPPPQIVEITQRPFGLWETHIGYSDVVTVPSLLGKANWNLSDRANIRPSYKFTLEPGIWNPSIEVGDVVLLRIQAPPRADIRVPIRLEEIQITLNTDGAEEVKISSRAQEPETFITPSPIGPIPTVYRAPAGRTLSRHRLHPWDELALLLRNLGLRIGRQERSPGA
jgi:hypothetical protein